VFLFRQAQAELAKFDFRATPVALKAESFPEYLEGMRKDFTVVVAATPAAAAGLMSHPAGWERIGAPAEHVFRKAGAPYGSIGVGGAASGLLEAPAGTQANLSVAAGAPIGGTGTVAPVEMRLRADNQMAAIWINGQEVASTTGGAVVAVVSPQGIVEALVLEVADGLRVPIDMQPLPLYELAAAGRCLNLGNVGWRDVSLLPIGGRVRVRVDNYRPFASHATFYVVGDRPAAPALSDVSGSGEPAVVTQSYHTGMATEAAALERALAADQVSLPIDAPAGSFVSRVQVTVDDNGDYNSLVLDFGVQVVRALGRVTVDRDEPRRSIVCGAT
jgi:hypothetical protein